MIPYEGSFLTITKRMHCLSDSGEFLEVESNYGGKHSHLPSQPAGTPSPRSMLRCDKRLPLDPWNGSGSQENVFVNPRSTFESSQTPRQGILQSGAVVKSHRGLSGVERGKGIWYQWKENMQCSKGDQCSFRHESNDRA